MLDLGAPTNAEWVVVQSTDASVSALNIGEAFRHSTEGFWIVEGVTTYPRGTQESGWTTPAYREERVDIDCSARRYRLARARFMRGNADSFDLEVEQDAPFVSVDTEPLRAAQWTAMCARDHAAARVLSFRSRFEFMDKYRR